MYLVPLPLWIATAMLGWYVKKCNERWWDEQWLSAIGVRYD